MQDGVLVAAAVAEVGSQDRDGSQVSEFHSQGMMSWQPALRLCRETPAPQLNPTSSNWLRPDWPMSSAQAEREAVQVERGQQAQEVEMERGRLQVAGRVMQLEPEIPR